MGDTPMTAYDEMVKDLIENDSELVFGNISAEHAKFIIKAFIDSAKQSIEILSGSLCNQFYTGIDFYKDIKAAAEKIKSPGKIRIITMGDTEHQTIRERFAEINNGLKCEVISYIPCQYKGEQPIEHFMVVDNKRYREEEAHEEFRGTMPVKVKASVCCNGEEKAREIVSRFNLIWGALNETKPVHA